MLFESAGGGVGSGLALRRRRVERGWRLEARAIARRQFAGTRGKAGGVCKLGEASCCLCIEGYLRAETDGNRSSSGRIGRK